MIKKFKEYAIRIISIILIIYTIGFVLFEEVRTQTVLFILDPIFKPLFVDMLKESEERERRIANGEKVEMITGKDTVLEWKELYYIFKQGLENEKILFIYEDYSLEAILGRIRDYAFHETSLYVISHEGYAVIDNENLCKVYITAPINDFSEKKEYGVNSKGEKMFYSGKVEDSHIVYLDCFEEYSETEQNNLNKMLSKL